MKLSLTIDVGQTSLVFEPFRWRKPVWARDVVQHRSGIGPFYLIVRGLPFSHRASSRIFREINEGPVGDFARTKRDRAP